MADVIRVGDAKTMLSFEMRLIGMDRALKQIKTPAQLGKVVDKGFRRISTIVEEAVKNTFNKGSRPSLRERSAELAEKDRSQTLVDTGRLRDGVTVTVVKKGLGARLFIGVPAGPLSTKAAVLEFGARIAATESVKGALRARGFSIREDTRWIVIPPRPVFKRVAVDPKMLREIQKAMAAELERAFRA